MLSFNNDVGYYVYKNVKRELCKILDSYFENGKLKYYDIIVISNLVIKYLFFEYVCLFDFIIVLDIGLINVDVKSWGEKIFYYFDVFDEYDIEISNSNIEKVVGYYIS